jgi:hypothetical protein
MKVIPGRILDLQKFFKPYNFRCGSTVIISGFGGLNFRGVIFDGFQPASHILDHNELNGHSDTTFVGISG